MHFPEESRAQRPISTKSDQNYRGSLVDPVTRREIRYESRLERNFFVILMASGAYREILEQQRVVYVGPDGKDHNHWFDAVVVRLDGSRVAVDVKPFEFVESSGIRNVQKLIREQHPSFASAYVVRTEHHTHPDDVADARALLIARKRLNAEADAAVERIAESLIGWICIADLVAATGMKAAAYNAIVRLIGAKRLSVYDGARISYSAYLTRTQDVALAA